MRVHAGTRLFAAAVVVALVAGHLLRETPGYAERGPDGSLHGDLEHYVYWTRLVTLGGVQAAYSGSWPETYAVYPPVTLYGLQALGNVYRAVEDPSFDVQRAQSSLWLRAGLKLLALGWHLLAGLAIWLLVRRRFGPGAGGVAGALYVANPAALFDVAHWGQPDGAHSLFAVLGIGWLGLGQEALAWGAMALAALAKPQAWSLLPLLLIGTLRGRPPAPSPHAGRGSEFSEGEPSGSRELSQSLEGHSRSFADGVRRLALDFGVAAMVSLLVVAPFVVTGHLGELLTLPRTVASVMPVVSADAHNLWWLVLAPHSEDALTMLDAQRLLGPLSIRVVAGLLVLADLGVTYWLYWTRRVSLPEAAALGALGWFVFTTQAHENHLFFALPLLSLAWPARRGLLVVLGVLSLTILLNMVLHDHLLLEALGTSSGDRTVRLLRDLNAALNVACCLSWTAWASLRPAASSAPASLPLAEVAHA